MVLVGNKADTAHQGFNRRYLASRRYFADVVQRMSCYPRAHSIIIIDPKFTGFTFFSDVLDVLAFQGPAMGGHDVASVSRLSGDCALPPGKLAEGAHDRLGITILQSKNVAKFMSSGPSKRIGLFGIQVHRG